MDPRISILTLGVSDLERSRAFYLEGFGFPYLAKNSNEGIAFFEVNRGTLWLALYPRHLLAEDASIPDSPCGFPGFTLAHNLRSPEEVDAAFAHLIKAGAQRVKPPQAVFWGGYSSYITDPDGFLWEIAYNPFSWIE